jgi:tRNA-splicing endonuclease subunit Sen54
LIVHKSILSFFPAVEALRRPAKMADADEDVIPSTSQPEADDLEDETQDFRFLAQLTAASSSTGAGVVVPKRGTKDFEPNPTRSQASALDASRLAMHTALSAPRIHSEKTHLVGQYLSDESQWRWEDNGAVRRTGRCVVVHRFKSTHSKTMGQADRNNWMWFLPEEALYLLERGSLDIRWPDLDESSTVAAGITSRDDAEVASREENPGDPVDGDPLQHAHVSESEEDPKVGELPMSLQGAYASFIGRDGLSLERYNVYAGLKRSGYIVQRAPTWDDGDFPDANGHASPEASTGVPKQTTTLSTSHGPEPYSTSIYGPSGFIRRICSWLFKPQPGESCPSLGPLVAPGLYRNYADIFRALTLIPFHNPNSASPRTTLGSLPTTIPEPTSTAPSRTPQPPYRIHLYAWKPNTSYKKTAPPPPDYRICVVDARTTSMPTLTQISDLLDSVPEDSVSQEKVGRLEARLKHGKRNVILAVVDVGIVSYLRLSDACFGADKLFEQKFASRAKGKGKGRGGGGAKGRAQGQKK